MTGRDGITAHAPHDRLLEVMARYGRGATAARRRAAAAGNL